MKICAYVNSDVAKKNYKNESYNTRKNVGMSVVVDILRRAGHTIEYASSVNVNRYDFVLVSLTSDCDWWTFAAERVKWPAGNYRVIVGGQGVLNVRPFLNLADYFVLGRAENVIAQLVDGTYSGDSVIEAKTFSLEKRYRINQVERTYPYSITLEDKSEYLEDQIGCNHRCLFCGYTWQRKHCGYDQFKYGGLWSKNADVERAMIDIANGMQVDFQKLRTTAIDGLSERLRFSVNKKITREMLRDFTRKICMVEKPHQVKYYNIVGYPTECDTDWFEFLEDIMIADRDMIPAEKQMGLILHSTPFRPMPATPLACEPASYRNYRGEIARVLGAKHKGNIFYQGNRLFAVESMGTESLPTVFQSMICHRGTEKDADNFLKVALSKKFSSSSVAVKTATLEKYFDAHKMFKRLEPGECPTRYLKSYTQYEKMWGTDIWRK